MNRIFAALEADGRIERRRPITLAFADGVLTMDGELTDVAGKTRALSHAAALPEVRGVVDRLRVEAAVPMEDGEIRDHVRDALLQDSAFEECRVVVVHDGGELTAHDPPAPRGSIRVSVEGGVVTLDGDVPGLAHRRLAGVLAWWVPGTRDVENRLGVVPPESDSDDEITDAVRMALEKDPFVDAAQIEVRTRNGKVKLHGTVSGEAQKQLAVHDAWYVLGVNEVTDEIDVLA